ncbi:hypothetical protein [Terracoccus sp. 273MFTsu3.1]|uniref:hypothetical protein n=1 Tax=Terracoccus sp. 273MFTsu3.1 TaxID=1172188 RepID=UPI0012DD8B0B|nr:hypothetical protein [Terracoccus sp. 273MFTsu3.1]
MSLCLAFAATDGLVALCDGKTTFSTISNEADPRPALTDTRKLAIAPNHLPYCLLFVNRGSYGGFEVAHIADEMLGELEAVWTAHTSLESLACRIQAQFARLEVLYPVAEMWTDEGTTVRSEFMGLLCGYPDLPEPKPEFWILDVTRDSPQRAEPTFRAIGTLTGEADRYLNEIGGHSPWYRNPMRERFGQHESVREMTAVAAAEAAVTGLQLAAEHEKSHGLSAFVGGTWRSVVIRPQLAEDPLAHPPYVNLT